MWGSATLDTDERGEIHGALRVRESVFRGQRERTRRSFSVVHSMRDYGLIHRSDVVLGIATWDRWIVR